MNLADWRSDVGRTGFHSRLTTSAACRGWPLWGNQDGKLSEKRVLAPTSDRRFNCLRNTLCGPVTRAFSLFMGKIISRKLFQVGFFDLSLK